MGENSIGLTEKEVLSLAVQIAAAEIGRSKAAGMTPEVRASKALRTAIDLIFQVDHEGLEGFLQSESDR